MQFEPDRVKANEDLRYVRHAPEVPLLVAETMHDTLKYICFFFSRQRTASLLLIVAKPQVEGHCCFLSQSQQRLPCPGIEQTRFRQVASTEGAGCSKVTSRISLPSHFLGYESCQRDGTAHGQWQRIIRRFAAGALDVDCPNPSGFRDYWIVHGGSLDNANYRVGLELVTPPCQQGLALGLTMPCPR